MTIVNKKSMFLFLLISSIGSWLFWLALGPFVSGNFNGSSDLGTIGLIRQLSIFIGVMIGTATLDSENDLKQAIFVELLTVFVGAFVIISLSWNIGKYALFGYASVRFLLSGSSFIYTFSTFTKSLENKGNGIIAHLLSTQGAVVFASFIGVLILGNSKESLFLAISIDIVSSVLLIILMINFLRKGGDKLKLPNIGKFIGKISSNIHKSVTAIWLPSLFPWNLYYVLSMFLISGLAVLSDKFGSKLTLGLNLQGFSTAILLYGISLWLTGFMYIKKTKYTNADFFVGALLGLFAGLLNINGFYEVGFLLYLVCFGLLLNGLNKKIISSCSQEESGYVRGSLGFYLTTIFAFMEYMYGNFILINFEASGIGYFQIFAGLLLIVLVSFFSVRKSN